MADLAPIAALFTVLAAVIGAIATLRKSGGEGAKAVSEGAGDVVTAAMQVVRQLEDRVDALEAKVRKLERMSDLWDAWADRIVGLLERVFIDLDGPRKREFIGEAEALRATRPKRRVSADEDDELSPEEIARRIGSRP